MPSASPTLIVAIPCLNEAATIAAVIGRVPRSIDGISRVDVVVVDDGSTDETASEAERAGARVIRHMQNRGVGTAFQSAVAHAIEQGYDLMVNIDGDGQFAPEDIPKLVTSVQSGKTDMATASRFKDPSLIPDMPAVKLYGNHMMSYLISRLIRHRYMDVSCGFRCYSRETLMKINLHGAFTYTQEIFLDLSVKNLKIVEVPVKVLYFKDRKSRVAGNILKYAVNSATIIFRGYRDYFPLRFFWGISAAFFAPALVFGLLFLVHFLRTGQFTGYLYSGFLSGFMLIISLTFLVLGIVADMLDRVRGNQERILYLLRKSGSAP